MEITGVQILVQTKQTMYLHHFFRVHLLVKFFAIKVLNCTPHSIFLVHFLILLFRYNFFELKSEVYANIYLLRLLNIELFLMELESHDHSLENDEFVIKSSHPLHRDQSKHKT